MQQLRDAPVEEDVNEDKDAVGDGDGEEVGNEAAEREKLRACCEGGVAIHDLLYAAKAGSAPVNQQHVEAKASEDGSRDVDRAKVYQGGDPSTTLLDRADFVDC
jgi:hypothetical protein